jgi:hypothetical protein
LYVFNQVNSDRCGCLFVCMLRDRTHSNTLERGHTHTHTRTNTRAHTYRQSPGFLNCSAESHLRSIRLITMSWTRRWRARSCHRGHRGTLKARLAGRGLTRVERSDEVRIRISEQALEKHREIMIGSQCAFLRVVLFDCQLGRVAFSHPAKLAVEWLIAL